jgi:DNA polymerase
MTITFDYETRGYVNLKKCGSWAYTRDPRTQVMCMSWIFDDDVDDVGLWHRAFTGQGEWDPIEESPFPDELVRRIADGEPIEAHAAQFERFTTENVMRREFPWFPAVREDRWSCSAAKAAMLTLPRKLEEACEVLGLREQKDMAGHNLMKKLSKPARPVKSNPFREWYEDPGELSRLFEYNRQDVRAEHCLSSSLRDLSLREVRIFQMDAEMNRRGVRVDRDMIEAALEVAEKVKDGLNSELRAITDGSVPRGSSREGVKSWLAGRGMVLENTQGPTLDAATKREDLDEDVRRVVHICREVNRTSNAKYEKLLNYMDDEDDCVRGTMLYCGASRTTRWSGSGPQFHNFPRGGIKDIETAAEAIKTRDPEWIQFLFGNPMDHLSQAARGTIVPREGKELYVADYSAIEARDVFWVNDDEKGLDDFRASDSGEGAEIYCKMAEVIFAKPVNKGKHPEERFVGKQSILGSGFGMGWEKFSDTCARYGRNLPERLCKQAISAYRDRYRGVVDGWGIQEQAAVEAVRSPGAIIPAGKVQWAVRGQFLHCKLPSGGLLSYMRPMLVTMLNVRVPVDKGTRRSHISVNVPARLGEARAVAQAYRRAAAVCKEAVTWSIIPDGRPLIREQSVLTYLGTEGKSRKWRRLETYGGKLMENIVQKIAREQMADAMVRADDHGVYDVLLSVHDELISEADELLGDLDEYNELMATPSDWCRDCPVAVEGWKGKRYKKA